MTIEGLFYIHFQVSDLARSRLFYRDVLGWTLQTDEPGVAGFWFGSAYLVLSQDPQPAAQAMPAGKFEVAVRVDDLEAHHDQLTRKGANPGPIEARPWGERNFSFHDPDGNTWLYGQPVRQA